MREELEEEGSPTPTKHINEKAGKPQGERKTADGRIKAGNEN